MVTDRETGGRDLGHAHAVREGVEPAKEPVQQVAGRLAAAAAASGGGGGGELREADDVGEEDGDLVLALRADALAAHEGVDDVHGEEVADDGVDGEGRRVRRRVAPSRRSAPGEDVEGGGAVGEGWGAAPVPVKELVEADQTVLILVDEFKDIGGLLLRPALANG